jgi:23S rRNA (uracil1939-C5)-methyltransferase
VKPKVERFTIDSVDLEGKGIARREDGQVVFIDGALPAEVVEGIVVKQKNKWQETKLMHILQASSQRTKPLCPYFGLHRGACGDCKLQHLETTTQVAIKTRVLEDNLWHIGKVKPENVLPATVGTAWGYKTPRPFIHTLCP